MPSWCSKPDGRLGLDETGKWGMGNQSRLDLLIYAHDGRGLGHISRSVAIGLAARRLFPALKIAVVTGSPFAQMLVGALPLEIVKLPSYQVSVSRGESHGTRSHMNLTDDEMADLRVRLIAAIVAQLQPRCVLADHLPLGKRDELKQALASDDHDCIWLLGIRAVLGKIPEFRNYSYFSRYRGVFWYGDSTVIPAGVLCDLLPLRLQCEELGYVSRAFELEKWGVLEHSQGRRSGITIAFSWLTEHTAAVLGTLADIAESVGDRWGQWHVFLGRDYSGGTAYREVQRLADEPHCSIEPLSDRYLQALASSLLAVVAGGYNTLTDLLWAGTPSVVMVRNTQDAEQDMHVSKLTYTLRDHWISRHEESVDTQGMEADMADLFAKEISRISLNVGGSENAATRIAELLS